LTAVGFLAAGCAHLSSDILPNNVAPLFHIQTDPEKETRRLDAAGPFYSQSESPEEREWSLRPFFWYRKDRKNQTEMEFLYPLGSYKKPLFRHADDGRGRVHFFFPALMLADWDGLERHYGSLGEETKPRAALPVKEQGRLAELIHLL
jgi:hypothetical protein